MNVLLLTMSTINPKNVRLLSAYKENEGHKDSYLYLSQLEPGSKYFFSKLASQNKKFDKVVVLCTDETNKAISFNLPLTGLENRTIPYSDISSYDLYKKRVTGYILGNDENDTLFEEVYGIKQTQFPVPHLYSSDELDVLFHCVQISFSTSAFAENIKNIIEEISGGPDEKTDLYLDAQGGARTAVLIINTVLNMLSSTVTLKEVCTVGYQHGRMENPLIEETESYLITGLASALNSFLEYGRGDMFCKDYKNYKIRKDSRTNNSEKYISENIQDISDSLMMCNMDLFSQNIEKLKKNIKNYKNKVNSEDGIFRNAFFTLAIHEIERAYGVLLTGDASDLIEQVRWCLDKKYYQQALTLLESHTPEFLMKCGFLYYDNDENTLDAFASVYELPYDLKNDTCHFIIKNYLHNRLNKDNVNGSIFSPEICRSAEKLEDMKNGRYMFLPDRYFTIPVCLRSVLLENKDSDNFIDLINEFNDQYSVICKIRNNTNHANKNTKNYHKIKTHDIIQATKEKINSFTLLLLRIKESAEKAAGTEFAFVPIDWDKIHIKKQDDTNKVFINLSNHPSIKWSPEQCSAAIEYGEIIDIPFPQIAPSAGSEEIDRLVSEYYEKITRVNCSAVMLQGEYVFTFRLTELLKSRGIKVLSSCSERRSVEYTDENGKTQTRSEFEFAGFREY